MNTNNASYRDALLMHSQKIEPYLNKHAALEILEDQEIVDYSGIINKSNIRIIAIEIIEGLNDLSDIERISFPIKRFKKLFEKEKDAAMFNLLIDFIDMVLPYAMEISAMSHFSITWESFCTVFIDEYEN